MNFRLKDKLRHIKNVKVYWSKNWFEPGSTEPEVARNTSLIGARGKTYEECVKEKKENYLIGYSLKPIWLFVIGYA